MKKITVVLSTAMIVLLTPSCGAKKVNLIKGEKVSTSDSDLLKTEGLWIKNKGKKFDVSIRMTNISNKPLLIMGADMICKKGQHIGRYERLVNEQNIPSNNPQFLTFEPGEMKQFHTTCYLGAKYDDRNFYFLVKTVYENTSKNIALPTKGNVLAKNIELKIKL